jgi:hypothetical protein
MPVSLTGRSVRAILASLLAISLAGPLTAQQQTPAERDAFRRAQEEFNRVPNTPGDGPYPATIETDPGLPGHVIYRPADLSPFDGGKLPILVWGNGACVDDGTAHRLHLAEIASYGYLVVAAGGWRSGPGATEPRAPQPAPSGGGLPRAATTAADVSAGIDWAIAENTRNGSDLRGKVATGAIAVAGHSCGGLQAIEIAADPRIKTVLVHNSGVFNDGASPIPGITVSKAMLDRIHTPVIYILGGPTDIAYANGTDDFAACTPCRPCWPTSPSAMAGRSHNRWEAPLLTSRSTGSSGNSRATKSPRAPSSVPTAACAAAPTGRSSARVFEEKVEEPNMRYSIGKVLFGALAIVASGALALAQPGSAQAPANGPPANGPPRFPMRMEPDPRVQQRTYHFADTDQDLAYTVFVSSKVKPDTPAPLIVALHGYGGDSNFIVRGKLVDLAEENGYIVVGPMGYNATGWYGSPVIVIGGGPVDPPNLAELSEKDVMNVLAIARASSPSIPTAPT